MNKELEQIRIEQIPAAEMPSDNIKKTGKKTKPEPMNQGNLLKPGKIDYGNLPQDQKELFNNGTL